MEKIATDIDLIVRILYLHRVICVRILCLFVGNDKRLMFITALMSLYETMLFMARLFMTKHQSFSENSLLAFRTIFLWKTQLINLTFVLDRSKQASYLHWTVILEETLDSWIKLLPYIGSMRIFTSLEEILTTSLFLVMDLVLFLQTFSWCLRWQEVSHNQFRSNVTHVSIKKSHTRRWRNDFLGTVCMRGDVLQGRRFTTRWPKRHEITSQDVFFSLSKPISLGIHCSLNFVTLSCIPYSHLSRKESCLLQDIQWQLISRKDITDKKRLMSLDIWRGRRPLLVWRLLRCPSFLSFLVVSCSWIQDVVLFLECLLLLLCSLFAVSLLSLCWLSIAVVLLNRKKKMLKEEGITISHVMILESSTPWK